jgi:P pilus assembly protein, pilin FimA
MLKKLIPLAAVMMATVSAGNAMAATAQIKFHGSIVDSTCDIIAADKDKTVELGSFPKTMFKTAGSVSPAKAFTITLENCNDEGQKYGIRFDGRTFANDSSLIQLDKDSDSAGSLGVQLLNNNDEVLNIAEQNTQADFVSSGANKVITLKARYKSVKDDVQPMDDNATVRFAIEYK